MPYTPDLVHELNTLIRFDLDSGQHGIKVHKDADEAVKSATQCLHAKGLISATGRHEPKPDLAALVAGLARHEIPLASRAA